MPIDPEKLKKLLQNSQNRPINKALIDAIKGKKVVSDDTLTKVFKSATAKKEMVKVVEKQKIGPKGDKGDRGEEGIPGKDGKNGQDGKDGKNGADGSPDNAFDIKEKLESLKGQYRLDASAIKNLPTRPIVGVAAGGRLANGGGGAAIQGSGTYLQSTGTVQFSNSNGVTFGLSGNGVMTASVAGIPANVSFSAGTSSADIGSVVFSNSNGVSFGLNGSTITGSHNGLTDSTPFRLTANDSQLRFTSADSQLRFTSADSQLRFTSADSQLQFTSANSNFVHASAAFAGTSASGTIASNGISISIGPYLTTAMASNRGSDFVHATAAFAGTSASGTIASNGISVSIGPYITTGALSGDTSKYVQAWELTGNTAGTTSSLQGTKMYFEGGNSITVSGASNTIKFSVGNYLTTAAASDHSHGNPTLALTNLTGTTASASNGFTLSLSAAAAGAGGATLSFYENIDLFHSAGNLSSVSGISGSSVWVNPFILPQAISASFIRFPGFINVVSTASAGTSAGTTFSNRRFQTDAIVIYTQGTGANSLSIQSIFSTSTAWTMNSVVLNGTDGSVYTISYDITCPGVGGKTTEFHVTTSRASSNYRIESAILSNFDDNVFFDMPFATSLSAGNYWVAIGKSTTTSTGGVAGLVGASFDMYTWGARQVNSQFRFAGEVSTETQQIVPWNGIHSTNAFLISTASIAIGNVSTTANNPKVYFQLHRSA